MSHYKELNKELVEQVQNMKIQLNLYCNEIVFLKRDMMDKHESQVFLRKKCFHWAVENFKHLIETVEPECSLIDKIREYEPEVEKRSSRTSRRFQQRSSGSRSSNEDRRSSQLRLELQRSNNVIHSRRSMYTISPTRSSNAARSLESDMETDGQQDDEERLEENESPKKVNSDHVLYEESEDDEEVESEPEMAPEDKTNETASETLQPRIIEQNNYETAAATTEEEDDFSQYASVEEIIDISHTRTIVEETPNDDNTVILKSSFRLALNDLTNTQNNSKQQKPTTKKRKAGRPAAKRRAQTRTKHLSTTEDSHESTDSSPTIARNRNDSNKQKTKIVDKSRHTDCRIRSMELDESIQQNRCEVSNVRYNLQRKSIHMPENIIQEVTLNDMTLQNFNAAVASSTPNSRRNSIRNVLEPSSSIDSASPLQLSSNGRPSRKCKPKVLLEPKLGTKMRNETKETLPKNKAKKKK